MNKLAAILKFNVSECFLLHVKVKITFETLIELSLMNFYNIRICNI